MTEHTPGPWIVKKGTKVVRINDAEGNLICTIATIFTCIRCEQNYTVPAGTTACPVCDWSHESAIRQQEFDTL